MIAMFSKICFRYVFIQFKRNSKMCFCALSAHTSSLWLLNCVLNYRYIISLIDVLLFLFLLLNQSMCFLAQSSSITTLFRLIGFQMMHLSIVPSSCLQPQIGPQMQQSVIVFLYKIQFPSFLSIDLRHFFSSLRHSRPKYKGLQLLCS